MPWDQNIILVMDLSGNTDSENGFGHISVPEAPGTNPQCLDVLRELGSMLSSSMRAVVTRYHRWVAYQQQMLIPHGSGVWEVWGRGPADSVFREDVEVYRGAFSLCPPKGPASKCYHFWGFRGHKHSHQSKF